MNSSIAESVTCADTHLSALHSHAESLKTQPMSDLLVENSAFSRSRRRANGLAFSFGHLHIDFSKQRLTTKTIALLKEWAESCGLVAKREALFAGQKVNTSEKRAALHMAARWPATETPPAGMEDAVAFCHQQRQQMVEMVNRVHAGQWYGATGQTITDVVHIGVGGSDLGPKMVSEALADRPSTEKVAVHYVSTMDGSQLLPLMERLNPATTLLVIASKSFTTADTQFNVRTALAWLSHALEVDEVKVCRHQLIGVSTKPEKMTAFGISESKQLVLGEWIGGRFSLWSPIGISLAMQLGIELFDELLAGAHAMDKHFMQAPIAENLPALMALVGAWNCQFLNIPTHAVLPYDGRLKSLPAYLQQLEMESNGKSIGLEGDSVNHTTCPIFWGDVGPNGQHAFYQLLHQGKHTVSADFVAVTERHISTNENVDRRLEDQEQLTLAHCLAQSQLLALGDDAIPIALRGSIAQGYRGNQPNSVLLLKSLDARALGMLIALYEHKVFVQSVVWNLNPFDQPGVELGKCLATNLYQTLTGEPLAQEYVEDSGTVQLLRKVNTWRDKSDEKGVMNVSGP